MPWRIALAGALITAKLRPVPARDNGQLGNVPPDISRLVRERAVEEWASRAATSPTGIAPTTRRGRAITGCRIDGKWIPVPEHAVVDNSGNPTGDAVVWYTEFNGSVFIRCFVELHRVVAGVRNVQID
jgi:hypothetical protein